MSQYALNSFDIFGSSIIKISQFIINKVLKISKKIRVNILPLKRGVVFVGEPD